jgi:hypothetical protein
VFSHDAMLATQLGLSDFTLGSFLQNTNDLFVAELRLLQNV